ncbi:type IV secretory system conjugative DNA transfer family protein [Clostridium gasigenes]|uniref:type IV secretory system conjugative DNA transfer family protein n=1 Tax=Clostridium gasigenes TaxID=94869 RepID=UPI001C0AD42C|nr:type IV secretory system conjugative DNA transfer family protein [Clostridium gasigenes]MBU3107122.1 type IV secretory system conjugative DNA transfer family protein [Clostridium gasigenes]
MEQIRNFTMCMGSALVIGEFAAAYFNLKNNKVDKLSNNEIKDHREAKKLVGDDGLILSNNIQLKEKIDFEGIGVFGATGSGKTTKFFVPNLLSNNIKGSIIVTDPKGELYKLTSKYQENVCGREVYKIDLTNPNYSYKYNLLENCKDIQEVLQLSSSLLYNGSLSLELQTGKKAGGIEWVQMAEPLLSAALLYAKDLKYPFNNVEFAFQLILTLDTEQLQLLIEKSKNIDAMTQFNIFMQVSGADRTEGSIKITLASNLKAFTDKNINTVNSKTNIYIERFRKKKSILYISYPERKASYYSPFVAPLFNSIIDKLLDSYNADSLPISMLFEEFANIGMLNNLSSILATSRSREVSFTLCLQSISQLFQIYGQYNTKSILNNLKTKILLPGCSDLDTINYISSLCGNIEVNTMTRSKSGNNETKSYSKIKRKMFEDGELRTLDDDKALIVMANNQAILDSVEMYFENEEYVMNIFEDQVKMREDKLTLVSINAELKKLKVELAAELDEVEEEENSGQRLFTREV